LDHGSSWSAENVTNEKDAHVMFTESSMLTRGLRLLQFVWGRVFDPSS